MGKTFDTGTIAAITVVVTVAVLALIFAFYIPVKKNSGLKYKKINRPRIKDGASVRIKCISTGRYLRRRPDITPDCPDPSYDANTTLVTADATRAKATLWKLKLCQSCPPANTNAVAPSPATADVGGHWALYDAVDNDEYHFLTFAKRDTLGNMVFNGSRTINLGTTVIYDKGTVVDGVTTVPPVNNLDTDYWFEFLEATDEKGTGDIIPNATTIVTSSYYNNGADPVVYPEKLSSFFAFGIYTNPTVDPSAPGSPLPAPANWGNATCNELRSASLFSTVSMDFAIETL